MNTLIVGASEHSFRYSYMAAHMLKDHGREFLMIGKQGGSLLDREIMKIRDFPKLEEIDTITLYINPRNQKDIYDYLLGLNPRRIIFNPGTENFEFRAMAEAQNIEVVEACTLVMLQTGQY